MPLPKNKNSRFHQEIIALFTLFLATFLLLCLVSYARPLLGEHPQLQTSSENWCGALGYYIAHYLFSFFGLTAFFPVLVLIYTSVHVFIPGGTAHRLPFVVAGISGILISTSGLLATTPKLIFPPEFIKPGGYLGGLIWQLFGRFMGGVGSVLLLILLLIFSLMAAIRFSPIGSMKWMWKTGGNVKNRLPKKKLEPKKPVRSKKGEPAVSEPAPMPFKEKKKYRLFMNPFMLKRFSMSMRMSLPCVPYGPGNIDCRH